MNAQIAIDSASPGMSLRDYFAGLALTGLLGKYSLNKPEDQETIARMSYDLANAMLTERSPDGN